MNKNVVVSIILSCWFYYVKSDEICAKMIRTRKYAAAMSKAKNERNDIILQRCRMASRFSHYLFNDPYMLMCANYVTKYLKEHKELYYHAQKLCEIQQDGYKDLLKCKSLGEFEKCIHTNMQSVLRYAAREEGYVPHNACKYCAEHAFLKKCAKTWDLHRKCKRTFAAINKPSWFKQYACGECKERIHRTTLPRIETTLKPIVPTKIKRTTPPNKVTPGILVFETGFIKVVDTSAPQRGTNTTVKADTSTPRPGTNTTVKASVTKTSVCKKGKFGENCLKSCHCADNAICDFETGRCPKNCHHRYYGMSCEKTCPDGWYLKHHGKCNGKCVCTNVKQCEVTSAKCLDGKCIKGYVAMFKICFIKDYKAAGFSSTPFVEPVNEHRAGKMTTPQFIFIGLGVALTLALLFVIFSVIYSRYGKRKLEKKPDATNEEGTPMKSNSRCNTYNKITIYNPRDNDESSSSGSPRKQGGSRRRKRRRNKNNA